MGDHPTAEADKRAYVKDVNVSLWLRASARARAPSSPMSLLPSLQGKWRRDNRHNKESSGTANQREESQHDEGSANLPDGQQAAVALQ